MVPKINSSFSWTLKCNFTFTKSFKINLTIWLHIFAITIPTGYVTCIDYHWLPLTNNVKRFSNWSDSLLLPSFPLYHLAPHIKQWYCWYVILNKNFTFISAWWIFNWIKTSFSVSVGRVFVNLQTTLLDSGPHLFLSRSEKTKFLPAGLPTTLFSLLHLLEKYLALSLSSAAAL